MDRIKRRIALCLAASALAGVFTASPATAGDNCHPYPEAVCNTQDWYYECVVYLIIYGQAHDRCDS